MTGPGTAELAASPAATCASTRRSRRLDLLGCVVVAAVSGAVFWLAHAALSDDGYISLDYAYNLAVHGTWGLTAQLQSNTATSPLNVLLLAAMIAVFRLLTGLPHPIAALGVVTVAALTVSGWCWLRVARHVRVAPVGRVAGVALLVCSPLALSTLGLESTLLVALLLAMLHQIVRPPGPGLAVGFGLLAGLAVLTRLDAVVFVLVLGLGSARIRGQWWRALLPLLAVTLPWFAWSWVVLGSAIPLTLAIKQQQAYPQGWGFAGGPLLFLRDSTAAAAVSLLPSVLGLVALVRWLVRRGAARFGDPLTPIALFAVAGLTYFAVYCVLAVPPYLWYYVPTLAALDVFLAATLLPRAATPASFARPARGAGRIVAPAVLLLALIGAALDLAQGVPWRSPPIFGNYAEPADYARVGQQLPALLNGDGVESPGELGTLVFYCHCAVLDQFSDPARALPFVRRQIAAAKPGMRWLLEVNYRHLDRGARPAPSSHRLTWARGWVTERPGVWNVASPASGRGHFTLSHF